MPAVSVVIPCYNCAGSIPDTLASLKAQTETDWEAILVDDGSVDATPAVLDEAAKLDSRLRIIRIENGGPARARNIGARHAASPLVAFLDADDLWFPNKLASATDCLRNNPGSDAVFGRIAFFRDTDGPDATHSTVRAGSLSLADCLGENPACTVSNLTVLRDAFLATGGFAEDMRHAEDLEWMIRTVAGGLRIVGTTDLHMRYRASETGLSSELHAMHAGWRLATRPAHGKISPRSLGRAEATHLRYLARRALRMGVPSRIALEFAVQGLRVDPAAFLGGAYRGPATLLGCLLAPVLPQSIRRRAFA